MKSLTIQPILTSPNLWWLYKWGPKVKPSMIWVPAVNSYKPNNGGIGLVDDFSPPGYLPDGYGVFAIVANTNKANAHGRLSSFLSLQRKGFLENRLREIGFAWPGLLPPMVIP